MIRLDLKSDLIDSCCGVFQVLAEYKKVAPRGFLRTAKRSIKQDFRKGLKIINKKCKVFIELPKMKEVSDNSYSKESSGEVEEVIVADSTVPAIEIEAPLLIE